MSYSYAEEKVPGGKLARVTAEREGPFYRIMISGDFFAHPEEGIVIIENALGRLDGTEPASDIEKLLERTISETGIELIGIDVPAIVRLYKRCVSCGE